jgi:hypothetical protein
MDDEETDQSQAYANPWWGFRRRDSESVKIPPLLLLSIRLRSNTISLIRPITSRIFTDSGPYLIE